MSRVALAHHWMNGMRGGEKVLEQMCLLFPEAPIYTLVANPEALSPILRSHAIRTSRLQFLSKGTNLYKKLLPLFPWAVAALEVRGSPQVILSSDASLIKGLELSGGRGAGLLLSLASALSLGSSGRLWPEFRSGRGGGEGLAEADYALRA
jgi:hypothetical protein